MVLTDTGTGFTVADAILVEPHEIETLMVAADGVKFVANDAQDVIYVHADHLGNPQKMTDDGRTVVSDAAFTPFGEEDSIVGAGINNWRFPGQYAEDETGFHYNWFRHYDPTIGRYIQSDPIGLEGGLNTYAYAEGNPLSLTDPQGLSASLALKGGEGLLTHVIKTRALPLLDRMIANTGPGLVRSVLEKSRARLLELLGAALLGATFSQGTIFEYLSKLLDEYFKKLAENDPPKNSPPPTALPMAGNPPAGSDEAEPPPAPSAPAPDTAGTPPGGPDDDGGQGLFSNEKLSNSANSPYKGGPLTNAGRALAKHGSRPGSAFPEARGSPTEINKTAAEIVDEILGSPGRTDKSNRFGGLDVISKDGRGMRFGPKGDFMGFLEP